MQQNKQNLRQGWTTGACATAATKAAMIMWVTKKVQKNVGIILPKGQAVEFGVCQAKLTNSHAEAGVIKDAGDDPDVTHGATIKAKIIPTKNNRIVIKAGNGVGTITKPGLQLKVGEPAINPVPKKMITNVIREVRKKYKIKNGVEVIISIPNGKKIAEKTWNKRLGIIGGLSILGTTGIVKPYSCSAWIHSIHRGIDVARAENAQHIIAATGSTSEEAANKIYKLPDERLIDMGDFLGGTLKYLKKYPVKKITIAGGFAKITKIAQGEIDLHSSRSKVDMSFLGRAAEKIEPKVSEKIKGAESAAELLSVVRQKNKLASEIAKIAKNNVTKMLEKSVEPVGVEVIVVARDGKVLARV